MVQLIDTDLRTKEVTQWRGLHLFHAANSSCSQKLRIYLSAKGLSWHSHIVDLRANENLTSYFLGINPRGLVPVLVDEGEVHIESNDIMLHLEKRFPLPALLAARTSDKLAALLRHEDDLHLDLRNLTFRFIVDPRVPRKSLDDLDQYAITGSGTVRGEEDPHIGQEIEFWKAILDGGISDDAVRHSCARFRAAFDVLEKRLQSSPYLAGGEFSILDIAWIVYAARLRLARYPLAQLHPGFWHWFEQQAQRPAVARELHMQEARGAAIVRFQEELKEHRQTITDIWRL